MENNATFPSAEGCSKSGVVSEGGMKRRGDVRAKHKNERVNLTNAAK